MVNITTLRRRLAGTQVSNAAAKRQAQLFSPGEERAISDHCGVMANLGFLVTKDLLQRIAQNMLNSRNQLPKGQGTGSTISSKTPGDHEDASSSTSTTHTVTGAPHQYPDQRYCLKDGRYSIPITIL